MRVDLLAHTNPLEQLIIIMLQVFPTLIEDLGKLTDVRNKSYTDYDIQEITLIRLLALCCGIQSMTEIMSKLDRPKFIKNINKILKTNLKTFPCDDTISNVINNINLAELEKIQTGMIRKLIVSKSLDKFRMFNGAFCVAIDGTGLFSTRKDLGKGCIHKTHNKGTSEEYITYEYYVLEAKLICGDYVFSIGTEFLENENMTNEQDKQDCELKAAHRLIAKIRKFFPKLPIVIVGDALYANTPFMETCKRHNLDFIIRYKDTVMTTISEEFSRIDKTIKGDYEYVNDLEFGSDIKDTEKKINIIKYTNNINTSREVAKENNDKVDKVHNINSSSFQFITSFEITENNYKDIVKFGRQRWKIENQGFKSQKSKVLNIGHCYTIDSNGTKVNYMFVQFAHTLLTLLYYGSAIIKKLKETKVAIANLIYQELIVEQSFNLENTIQIRFDRSD